MASSSVSQEDTTANERSAATNTATWSKKIKMRMPRNSGGASSSSNAYKSVQQQHHEHHPHHEHHHHHQQDDGGGKLSQSYPHHQHSTAAASSTATPESPVLNRTRSKTERGEKPIRAGSASSTNSKLRVQRERRRTKRREAYMPSTEGTSTGEEEDNELFTLDNSGAKSLSLSIRNGDETNLKAPPQAHSHLGRKLSTSCRASKSPSDLDADDEDNQDYDSASMVSTSENAAACHQTFHDEHDDNASFRAQFQEIREAGMQQLAAAAAENDSSGLVSESSSCNDDIAKMLEKEKRIKTILMQEIEQKEKKVSELEKAIKELTRHLRESEMENEKLKLENQSLQKSLAKCNK